MNARTARDKIRSLLFILVLLFVLIWTPGPGKTFPGFPVDRKTYFCWPWQQAEPLQQADPLQHPPLDFAEEIPKVNIIRAIRLNTVFVIVFIQFS